MLLRSPLFFHFRRASVLQPRTLDLQEPEGKRRVGRPRLEWEVKKHAVKAAGNENTLSKLILEASEKTWLHQWKSCVSKYAL